MVGVHEQRAAKNSMTNGFRKEQVILGLGFYNYFCVGRSKYYLIMFAFILNEMELTRAFS